MEEVNNDRIRPESKRPKHAGGAPKKRIRRERSIRVRLSATEYFMIEHKAKAAGMRISDWFRTAANGAKVVPRLSKEDRTHLHLLAGMANNLNQLTRLAHAGGILSIARKCMDLLNQIDNVLEHLYPHDRQDS